MVVRTEQMHTFRRATEQDFEQRLMAHLREMYPERLENKGDEELLDFCQEGIERARDLDIRTEYDIARFLEYRVFLGESFERRGPDWMRAILYGDGSGTYKMDRLDECYRVRGASR